MQKKQPNFWQCWNLAAICRSWDKWRIQVVTSHAMLLGYSFGIFKSWQRAVSECGTHESTLFICKYENRFVPLSVWFELKDNFILFNTMWNWTERYTEWDRKRENVQWQCFDSPEWINFWRRRRRKKKHPKKTDNAKQSLINSTISFKMSQHK